MTMISNTELMALDNHAKAVYVTEIFDNWVANITVSVWGRGKATLTDKQLCQDTGMTGDQRYAGNCDECRYFMGCKFPKGISSVAWGEHTPGCCALILNESLQEETNH